MHPQSSFSPAFASILLLAASIALSTSLQAQGCELLATQYSPTTAITVAKTVAAGDLAFGANTKSIPNLPSFCRVIATLKPTSDSIIEIEVWLPVSGWNGKYLAVGSGGWGGSIAYDAMADALRRGYATSATDDGHSGPSGDFVLGHPEKLVDFAYRADHEMTLVAKKLVHSFYGSEPSFSYWNGCSGGGREGLLQAARFPDEFDGIIAGDPANIRRNAWAVWLANETFKDPASYIPARKYPMIHRAVLNACDAADGLKDGLISDPQSCHPDFKSLGCKAGDGPDCLTPRQVKTAQTIISPAIDLQGKVLFPRLEPGTELRWARLAGGPGPADLFLDEFRFVVYQNPEWDWRSFNLDRDAAKAHAIDKNVDELDPNLAAFATHGGKLLLYHGWADQQVAPGSTVDFYQSLIPASAGSPPASDWARLFMVPGMGHCSGGEGPDTFDKIGALEQWVELGKAPAEIIASHSTAGHVDRTRPLCAYPQTAHYKGTGSIDEAANFTCVSPQ